MLKQLAFVAQRFYWSKFSDFSRFFGRTQVNANKKAAKIEVKLQHVNKKTSSAKQKAYSNTISSD